LRAAAHTRREHRGDDVIVYPALGTIAGSESTEIITVKLMLRLASLFVLSMPALDVSHANDTPAGQPTAAMLQPVRDLVTFMSSLPPERHVAAFAGRGVCIIENFAPFVFCGANAVRRWESGFRAHANDLRDLAASFGAAYDFSESGDRVYFSLPTTWTGLAAGRQFEEHGAWAFVLQRVSSRTPAAAWRILGYGWGVSSYREAP
jgi:hypothetical protein